MSDSPRLTPGTGTYGLEGQPAALVVTRAAETWQFFAFVYAAFVTTVFGLLDEIPDEWRWWRLAGKLVTFAALTYFLLFNVRVRNWLARFMVRFKKERR